MYHASPPMARETGGISMSELERIRKYIDKTKCRDERYSATISEIDLFARFSADGHPIEAIILAFDYGRAKGYRKGRKEAVR